MGPLESLSRANFQEKTFILIGTSLIHLEGELIAGNNFPSIKEHVEAIEKSPIPEREQHHLSGAGDKQIDSTSEFKPAHRRHSN